MTNEVATVATLDVTKPYGQVYGELDDGVAAAYEQNGRYFGLDHKEVKAASPAEREAAQRAKAIGDRAVYEEEVARAVEAKLKAMGLNADGSRKSADHK